MANTPQQVLSARDNYADSNLGTAGVLTNPSPPGSVAASMPSHADSEISAPGVPTGSAVAQGNAPSADALERGAPGPGSITVIESDDDSPALGAMTQAGNTSSNPDMQQRIAPPATQEEDERIRHCL